MAVPIADIREGPGVISFLEPLPSSRHLSAEKGTSCPVRAAQVYVLTEWAASLSAHGKSMSPVSPAPEVS